MEAEMISVGEPKGFLRDSLCMPCDARGGSVGEKDPTPEAVRTPCDAHSTEREAAWAQRVKRYEQRQEARRERLRMAAEKTRTNANARLNGATSMADVIPFGQPILVGHYSEGRDRRYRRRIDDQMRKGIALSKRAEELEHRANSVGTGGISSDDPDAVAKLCGELSALERLQQRMKSANRCVRRSDRAGLSALDFDKRQIDGLFKPDFAGRIGFPSYAITNNGANMRRIKQRIDELEKRVVTPACEPILGDGWTITEDVEDNRILIRFAEKPQREMLDTLRANGFKWSPTRGAHVRMRSNGALYAAKRILGVSR